MVRLKVDGISFSYRAHPVFTTVSVDIGKGEVVAVIGCNGAGKSTFIKCINGLLSPIAGMVEIQGVAVDTMSRIERGKNFGYLSQKSEQVFPATVFDVVLAGRYPHSPWRFTRDDERIVAETLALLDLDSLSLRTFSTLSGGEQQQALIARALAQEASVLLFDEPTNNLDLRHQLQIMKLVRKISRERDITSLLAIHDLNTAAAFSDRIMILHDHTLFACGAPAEVLTVETLRNVFGVEARIYDHHGVPHIVVVDD